MNIHGKLLKAPQRVIPSTARSLALERNTYETPRCARNDTAKFPKRKAVVLKITLEKQNEHTRFKLEGKLSGLWVPELERNWLVVEEDSKEEGLTVDLSEVTFIDAEGQKLLARMHYRGARLQGSGVLIKSIIEQIEQAALASNQSKPRGT